MATEALNLPRGTAISIGVPRRLRIFVRALRIARFRRVRDRAFVAVELCRMNAVARSNDRKKGSWLEDLAQTQMTASMLSR